MSCTQKNNTDTQAIVESFKNGKNISKIAEDEGISPGLASLLLEQSGVRDAKSGRKQNYSCDESYFDKIDTVNKAYEMGLMFADGSVRKNGYAISIALQELDKRLLDTFRRHLKLTKPLRYIQSKDESRSNMFEINISSRKLNAALVAHGRTHDKSELNLPDLPDDLMRHFIRGYFDADGCIYNYLTKGQKRIWCVQITSANPLLVQMAEFIAKEVGVTAPVYRDRDLKAQRFMIRGTKQVRTFLDWLYEDAPMFMDRKFALYLDFLKYTTEMNGPIVFSESTEVTA